jgi:hypothetical protein
MDDFKTIGRSICVAVLASLLPWRGGVESTAHASFPVSAVQSGTVVVAPQDTYLNLDAINYSTDPLLRTYTWPNYKVANAAVLTFDLSAIPAGAVVTEAVLSLALVESDPLSASTYTVSAHKLVGRNPTVASATGYTADGVTSWTPNACCYNGVPLAQADISPAYDQRAIDKTPGFKTWTITAMVQEWLANPAANFGLLLNADASKRRDRYRFFASMEYPDAALRPQLRVTFSTSDPGTGEMFAPGDLLISLETGPVQWRHANGTPNRTLVSTVAGTGEGMGFDAAGNLYVNRWCSDPSCTNGNTVEEFNIRGQSLGTFGSGYDCGPHSIVFDATGTAYVGQGGCTGAILKFVPGQPPVALAVASEGSGSFWIDLAADGCTIFYTSWGPNVKRFNACTGAQRPNFNVAPLPGGATQDLRVLPDGGVLVSSGEVVARLNASGVLVQTYSVQEPSLWAGLDLVGDGTFWVGNYETSNVYRFDLTTAAVLGSLNAGSPAHTVVGVRVKH